MKLRYFDSAATSWPKPEPVLEAVHHCLRERGGNPGRSGHRLSIEAERVLDEVRQELRRFLGIPAEGHVILTRNVTQALNMALKGFLLPGDRVVTTSLEHNSVMRPLRRLEAGGVEVEVVQAGPDGVLDLDAWEQALRPGARLAVFTHGSNVTGTLLPLREMTGIAHRRGARVLVDAAQTAGCVPIDVQADGPDMLAVTGHKALFGPPGTGALCLGPGIDLPPWEEGGTGSRSEEEIQPDFLPDRLESGTPNTPGFAGLAAGIRYIGEVGLDVIQSREREILGYLLRHLQAEEGVEVYGPQDPARMIPVLSVNVTGADPADVSRALDEGCGILTRPGLHCAPGAHRTIGTFPTGTVRLAFDHRALEEDLDAVIAALEEIRDAVRE